MTMAPESEFSPQHRIPIGTQVVIRRDHEATLDGDTVIKPASSVGEVIEQPLTHEYSYQVRFADGAVAHARYRDLSIRRALAPEAEGGDREIEAYEEHLILRIGMGSRAYGLATEGSDTDEKGIFLPPAEWNWSIHPLPEQLEFKRTPSGSVVRNPGRIEGDDFCWWELEKFLRLAIRANPTALEVLYAPRAVIFAATGLGEELLAMRDAFVSKHIYQTVLRLRAQPVSPDETRPRAREATQAEARDAPHPAPPLRDRGATNRRGPGRRFRASRRAPRVQAAGPPVRSGLRTSPRARRRVSSRARRQRASRETRRGGGRRLSHPSPEVGRMSDPFEVINQEAVRVARAALDGKHLSAYPPGRVLFTAISGGHMYGFPSPDSDLDIRGCHLLPVSELLGLRKVRETFELMGEMVEGVEVDLVSHDIGKYLRLLMKNGGYILEQIFSPLVVQESQHFQELRAVARRAMTRNVFHHYGGFFRRQRQVVATESPLRAKSILYLFRVVMSGIHLLRSGEVETDIKVLHDQFRIDFLPDLWRAKFEEREKTEIADSDRDLYLREADRLEQTMAEAVDGSPLPSELQNFEELNDFPVRVRRSAEA